MHIKPDKTAALHPLAAVTYDTKLVLNSDRKVRHHKTIEKRVNRDV